MNVCFSLFLSLCSWRLCARDTYTRRPRISFGSRYSTANFFILFPSLSLFLCRPLGFCNIDLDSRERENDNRVNKNPIFLFLQSCRRKLKNREKKTKRQKRKQGNFDFRNRLVESASPKISRSLKSNKKKKYVQQNKLALEDTFSFCRTGNNDSPKKSLDGIVHKQKIFIIIIAVLLTTNYFHYSNNNNQENSRIVARKNCIEKVQCKSGERQKKTNAHNCCSNTSIS